MEYVALKSVHVASAVLSIAGFAVRGMLMLRGSALLRARFARVAPHVVDTVLLASAVWLAWLTGQFPFREGWLTAKVLALFVYIALGSVALRPGRSQRARTVAFALALCTVLYIVSVALTRDPAAPLSVLPATFSRGN